MTGDDKVSVIIPLYNSEKWISSTLSSVIKQSYENIEIIIVDDYSSDGSVEVVTNFQNRDKRIKLIKLKKNVGVAKARNIGLKESTGTFIAFIDSDDLWHKEKLKKQLLFMKKNDIAFSYGNYYTFSSQKGVIGERKISKNILPFKTLLDGNRIGLSTVMLDKRKIGDFEFPDMHHEDYALWLFLSQKRIVPELFSDESLSYYRIHESLSSNKFKSSLWTWNVLKKFEKNVIKRSFHFFHYFIMAITDSR